VPESGLEGIDAYVLCGGRGERLRAAVSDVPKALAPVAGAPFLAWMLELLGAQGLRRFVLCCGYKAEAIRCLAPYLRQFGEIEISEETSPLGTGGAVRSALAYARSESAFVFNGDTLPILDLEAMHVMHAGRRPVVTIAVADSGPSDTGGVWIGADGCVESFREKQADGGANGRSAGVYLVSVGELEQRAPKQAFSLERDWFPALPRGAALAYRGVEDFFDIGTPERYAEVESWIESNRLFDREGPRASGDSNGI